MGIASLALLVLGVSLSPGVAVRPASTEAACAGSVGPGIPPPASVPIGVPGFHAAWYGQSGYMSLCPGNRALATVAFYNSGSLGWVAGRMGESAFLGTWNPEPGQDRASALGGDGTQGAPNTGWPRYNRVAVQPAAYVGPGQVAWFQFTVQAPPTPGTYRLALRPLIEAAEWLEDYGVFWVVTVLPGVAEEVTFNFRTGVSPQDQTDIRAGIASARLYLQAALGSGRTGVVVNVIASTTEPRPPGWPVGFVADNNVIYLDTGHPNWSEFQQPFTRTTRHMKITAHEYVHVWQYGLGGELGCIGPATMKPKRTPVWLFEGMAEYLAYQTLIKEALMTSAQASAFVTGIVKGAARPTALVDMEIEYPSGDDINSVGYLAVEQLAAQRGLASLGTFCASVGAGEAWQTAFQTSFGISRDAFYQQFEVYRRAL